MKQKEIMLDVEYRFRVRHAAVKPAGKRLRREGRRYPHEPGIGFPGYTGVQRGTVRRKSGDWCWIEILEPKWMDRRKRIIRIEDRLRREKAGKPALNKSDKLVDVPREIQVRSRDVLGPVGQLTDAE